jgi:hypothetical protein
MEDSSKTITQFESDFFKAYQRTVCSLGEKARRMPRKTLIERTIFSQAESYYVEPETALRQLAYFCANGRFNTKRRCISEKYYDIMRKYNELQVLRRGEKPIDIAAEVVYSPAPRFYINTKSAFYIYYRALKKNRGAKVV